jgi:(E)-2-((N-methylformamido)methylene)succinate hydrolase
MTDHPPIVLVHGVGLDHTMWQPVATVLSQHNQVFAFDMLAHGTSPHPVGPYHLGMFVDHLAGQLDAAALGGADEFNLVGFSMGALVAQGLNAVHDRSAEERHAIVERVAAVRSGQYRTTIEPAIERWFSPAFAATHPAVLDAVRARLLANDEVAYGHAYEVFATADADLAKVAHGISAPTLVVTGADDQRSTPTMTMQLASAVANGRPIVISGVRHLLPLEAPATLAELLLTHFHPTTEAPA